MGGDFQFLDILILAAIAGFLLLRLRSVLGRRTGHERPPPEDTTSKRNADVNSDGNVVELPDRGGRHDQAEAAVQEIDADDAVAAALAQIRAADGNLTAKDFLAGARSAFELIVHAFATGDTGTLRSLLTEEVFEEFSAEIRTRLEAQETLETTVIGVKSADVIEARLEGRQAFVTVKFVSEQVVVTRDAEGHVIVGDPNSVNQITDIWTFSRNTRSRDPNWNIAETRSSN